MDFFFSGPSFVLIRGGVLSSGYIAGRIVDVFGWFLIPSYLVDRRLRRPNTYAPELVDLREILASATENKLF